MSVNPSMGIYKCWSCGASGDCFKWVMERRGVDFPEAMRILAGEVGMELRRRNPEAAKQRVSHSAIMDSAVRFFREQLSQYAPARDYCEKRGLTPEVLMEWEIGYAPDIGEAMVAHLRKQGVSLAEAKTLFLVDSDPQGGYYDKFRSRLMFPIRDDGGLAVAFGGRLLGPGTPKYINSSDTPLYRKSRVLYGLNKARDHIRGKSRAVLVEGYLDVIACHTAGLKEAVASLGTSLTEEHAKILSRWCKEVVIMYDSDDAGVRAAEKAIAILGQQGLDVRLVLLPEGDDPDSLLRKKGPSAVHETVATALPPLVFRLNQLEKRCAGQPDAFWSQVIEVLATAPDDLETERQIFRLAGSYPGIRDARSAESAIRRMVTHKRREQLLDGPPPVSTSGGTRKRVTVPLHGAEVVLFRAFLSEDFRRYAWLMARHDAMLLTELGIRVAQAIRASFPTEPPIGKPFEWIEQLKDETAQSALLAVDDDLRAGRITQETLMDTINFLKRKAAERKAATIRDEAQDEPGKVDVSARQRFFEELKRRKRPPEEDERDELDDPY